MPRASRSVLLASLLISLGLAACSGANGGNADAGTIDGELPLGEVTYYEHVRPVLAENCVNCHVAGGIGPFPLDTYAAAQTFATRIMEVTRDRIMPPWLVDGSGECRNFRDSRWLSDRELEILRRWDEQGEPMGDPSIPAPAIPSLPVLDGTRVAIETGVDYQPNTSIDDDYRCFVVEAPSATDVYLTGYEVHPGNAATVHHVIVFSPWDAGAAMEARRLDDAEPGPGYTCYGASGTDSIPVVLWAPGGGATNYPSGTGVRLSGGVPLIIQVHYNNLAGSGTDRTSIDLELATDVSRMARIVPIADFDMRVEPRMSSVSTTDTWQLSRFTGGNALPVTVYGAFPHMHTLGRTLRVDHIPSTSGLEACLVDVPRWDFNWQLGYFYERPITINTIDQLRITCTYDTSSRTEAVSWGEGTQDEMCLSFFYVVVANGL